MDIQRKMIPMGDDMLIVVTGGQEHIGTLVMAIPYQKENEVHVTCSCLNVLSHKDEDVARVYAKEYCLLSNHVTCCVCGIHYDNLSSDGIKEVMNWVKEDVKKMKEEVYGKL